MRPAGPPSGWCNRGSSVLAASSTRLTPCLDWQSLRAPIPWLLSGPSLPPARPIERRTGQTYRPVAAPWGVPDSAKRLSHLQTSWLQQVASWPELDAACARMNPRRCELWSLTMLNDILRGRQALFRLCSPRRKKTLCWVRMSLAPSAPDQPAFTALIEVTGSKVGRVSRYWVRRLYRHLLAHPIKPGNRP